MHRWNYGCLTLAYPFIKKKKSFTSRMIYTEISMSNIKLINKGKMTHININI